MENLVDLMQRLLEIQSGGRQRSPQLITEDERLMDGLRERSLAGKPPQTVRLSQDSPERTRSRLNSSPGHDAEMQNRARQQVGSTTGFCPLP
jgi:hypothetical protein